MSTSLPKVLTFAIYSIYHRLDSHPTPTLKMQKETNLDFKYEWKSKIWLHLFYKELCVKETWPDFHPKN